MAMWSTWVVCFFLFLAAPLLLVGQPHNVHAAATITINNLDGPGEGFNSAAPPDAASTTGGNAGATLGEQRLLAFEYAASIWAGTINSTVEIIVDAVMNPQSCSAFSGTLGSAGPFSVFINFSNAPAINTWFSVAQANSLAGVDLDEDFSDIDATFNSDVDDDPNCLTGLTWYYGLDGSPPAAQIDFTTTVLHEIGHGLGFLSLVNLSNGAKFFGLDDAYMQQLANGATGEAFPDMTNIERRTASRSGEDLVWTGTAVNTNEALASGKHVTTDQVLMYAPNPVEFGSSVSHFDTTLTPNELMEPFLNDDTPDVGLTDDLFQDIGWSVSGVSGCGDGFVDPGEQCDDGGESAACDVDCTGPPVCGDGTLNVTALEECDDGNILPDDGCDASCLLECGNGALDGVEECDDDNTVSGDGCSSSCQVETCFSCVGVPSTCTTGPLLTCRGQASNSGLLVMNDRANDNADNLIWRWTRGQETTLGDFGDPQTSTDYELCIFDETTNTPSLVFSAEAPAGGICRNNACWRTLGSNGYRYQDPDRTPDGIQTIILRAGEEGRARASVTGRGLNLLLPSLPLDQDSTVTAQLRNSIGECWESEYSTALRNSSTQFRARGD